MATPDGAPAVDADAVVIGAGPAGLWAAFELGLQALGVHVLDSLPHAGGQCAELYPDKPIYDIPGVPVCTGQELTHRLLQQLQPLQVPLHLGHTVAGLQADRTGHGDGWRLHTAQGMTLRCRALVIAAGVGAFVPRPLAVPGLEAWQDRQVFYTDPPPAVWLDRHVVVVGPGEAAVRLALHTAAHGAARVTLLHRTDRFAIDPALDDELQAAIGAARVHLCLGQPVGVVSDPDGRLLALEVATARDERLSLPVDVLLPRLGLHPRLGPIAEWGLAMERKHLVVEPGTLQTSTPGIYAVGDVAHYPGKRKLILCGFHEATLAAWAIAERLRPGQRIPLEYTTTSPRLRALLEADAP